MATPNLPVDLFHTHPEAGQATRSLSVIGNALRPRHVKMGCVA